MSDPIIILFLLAFIVAREVIFWTATHKLLNKLMSRSYHEYEMAKTVQDTVKKPEVFKVIEDAEDLSVMRDFL